MSQETTMRDVDWFAVGIIMLKMFTGKVPYMKNSLTVEKHPIIPYYLKGTTKSFLHVLFTKKFHTKLSGGGFQFHPYFAGVNWVAIRKAVEKDATVPWISIKHPMLLNDVIKEFVEAKRVDKTRKIFSFEFLRALLIAAGIVFVPILIGNTAGTLIRLTLCAL